MDNNAIIINYYCNWVAAPSTGAYPAAPRGVSGSTYPTPLGITAPCNDLSSTDPSLPKFTYDGPPEAVPANSNSHR